MGLPHPSSQPAVFTPAVLPATALIRDQLRLRIVPPRDDLLAKITTREHVLVNDVAGGFSGGDLTGQQLVYATPGRGE